MAHYAYLDDNNIVVAVTVGKDETELINGLDTEIYYALNTPYTVKRTSYNTSGGVHSLGGEPFRKNYAGIGYKFDGTGFYTPQPYPSWSLNQDTYFWEPPVARPEDDKFYTWNEEEQKWDEIPSNLE
jgi:hypothetical protein